MCFCAMDMDKQLSKFENLKSRFEEADVIKSTLESCNTHTHIHLSVLVLMKEYLTTWKIK